MFTRYREAIWFSIYICAVVLTQILGAKTTVLHIAGKELVIGMSALFIPFTLSMVSVVSEVYGVRCANAFIIANTCSVAFAAVFSAIAVFLPESSGFSALQEAYRVTFYGSFRFALTSVASFFCVQMLDEWVFQKMYAHRAERVWMIRAVYAAGIALCIDTLIFTTVDQWQGVHAWQENGLQILKVFFPYWLFRWFIACLGIPFSYAGFLWLKPKSTKCVD